MRNTIRESRKELKISQETLAKKASVSRTTISMIENNKGVVLKTSTMEKIADALKKTVKELFFNQSVQHVGQKQRRKENAKTNRAKFIMG